jgi:hypothetical protein
VYCRIAPWNIRLQCLTILTPLHHEDLHHVADDRFRCASEVAHPHIAFYAVYTRRSKDDKSKTNRAWGGLRVCIGSHTGVICILPHTTHPIHTMAMPQCQAIKIYVQCCLGTCVASNVCNVTLTSNLGFKTAEVAAVFLGIDIYFREL